MVRSTAILGISTHTAPKPTHSLAFPCFVPLVLENPVSKSIRSKPGWRMQPCPKGMHGYQDTGNPALTSEESAYRATRAHWKRSWALGTHQAKPLTLRKHLEQFWSGLQGPPVHGEMSVSTYQHGAQTGKCASSQVVSIWVLRMGLGTAPWHCSQTTEQK